MQEEKKTKRKKLKKEQVYWRKSEREGKMEGCRKVGRKKRGICSEEKETRKKKENKMEEETYERADLQKMKEKERRKEGCRKVRRKKRGTCSVNEKDKKRRKENGGRGKIEERAD